MEALVLLVLVSSPSISEVCANPLNEVSCEFVELFNPGPEAISTLGFTITDGDALDPVLPWDEQTHGVFPHSGVVLETDSIPPEGRAVILELGYLLDPCCEFAPGTVILTTGDNAILNGLAASSDPLTLFGPGGTTMADVLSTYGTPVETDTWQDRDDDGLDGIPFDPGNGLSTHRFPMGSPDSEGNWLGGTPTPGAPPDAPPDTFALFIQELWFTPAAPQPGSNCQIHAAVYCFGTVSPDQGFITVFLDADGDSLAGAGEPSGEWPASILGPGTTDTLSITFTAPEKGWYLASATACASYMGVPMPSGGGVLPVLTEVMANPPDQTTQEYIEVHFPGPGVFMLDGCSFTDGDAVDMVIPWSGTALLPQYSCGIILDPDYAGGLPIPEGARLFTVGNSSLGNGLTPSDPIVLYDRDGTMKDNILSTAGTPFLSDDPLQCDDDGLDSIPFDPGQGNSMERLNPAGPDAEYNWTTSEPGGSPGWLGDYGSGPDIRADTIIVPPEVTPGVPFPFEAIFSSVGFSAAQSVSFTVFNDLDADSLPDPGEKVCQDWAECLEPGESIGVSGTAVLPAHGFFLLRAVAQCPGDTALENNCASLCVKCGEGAHPVITEVLCNPSDQSRDEFVEVFYPGPGVFDPSLLSIFDGDATDALHGDFVPALAYAVILDPDYFSGSMPHDIPSGTPLILPGNSTIGDGLGAGDPVSLLCGGTVVSTYGTPDIPDDGVPYNPGTDMSVELLAPDLPDLPGNWFTNPMGPSPGSPPLGFSEGVDYGIRRFRLTPPAGEEGSATTLSATVEALGTQGCAFQLVFTAGGEQVASASPTPPAPGDSVLVEAVWEAASAQATIEALILCETDVNSGNNSGTALWNPPPGLVINEIMYSPESPGPEWVELYNGTEGPLNLEGFTFEDPSTKTPLPDHVIEPGAYALLCPDTQVFENVWGSPPCPLLKPSSWPVLNNTGDTLSLPGGNGADWVPYNAAWGGGTNTSLERRSPSEMGWRPSNWGSCASGSTPGVANSIGVQEGGPFLSAEPGIFSPDSDGENDALLITLRVPEQGFNAGVRVYDVTGRVVSEIWNGPVPGETLILSWDGSGMPVGRYIVFARAKKGSSVLEGVLVRILARPL
jgi:hypothetical protein